jgi:DNA mismatch repair ATPase MutL
VKLYKSFYRAASCNALRKPSNVDPFLCMHIRCPPGSYDVNIEPAKDDLLFSEPSKVISLVEKLFRGYYGEVTSETLTRSRPSPKHQAAGALNDNFDLLLARKAVCSAESSTTADSTFATQLDVAIPGGTGTMNAKSPRNFPDCGNGPDMNPEHASLSQMDRNPPRPTNVESNIGLEGSETHFNMYGMDDEDLLTVGSPPPTQPQFSQEAEDVEVRSARVTNPWSLAKLNAPARQNVGESAIQADPGSTIQLMTPGWGQNEAPRNVRQSACPQESTHRRSNLPSPVASSPTLAAYQNPGPPLRRRAYDEQHDQDDADIESTQGSIREASNPLPKARSPLSHGSPSSQRRSLVMDYNDQSRLMPMPPSLSSSGSSFKISLSTNRELAEILEFEQRKKAAVLHERRAQSDLAAREPKPVKLANIQRKSNDTPLMQAVSSQTRRALPNLDLREGKSDSARDFERRFAKSSGNEAESVIYRNSPHRSRYLAAKERLDHTDPESGLTQDACQSSSATSNTGDLLSEADVRLSEDDPRTYLARLSENGDKMNSLTGLRKTGLQIRRTKTAQLPLETIPTGAANHNLKAMASDPFPGALPLAVISGHQGQLDEYVGTGENSFIGWSANSRDVAAWEATLNGLISRNFRVRLAGGENVTPEVTVMLRTAIKAHADAHSFD